MPALDRGTYFQLALLLLIVPAQYFLTQWKPTTSAQRSIEIERLLTRLHTWQGKFTNPDWWRQRGQNAWNTIADFLDHFEKYGEKIIYGESRPDDFDDDPEGESPAYEVLKFRESNGYFGGPPCIKLTINGNSAINGNCHGNITQQPIKMKVSMGVTIEDKVNVNGSTEKRSPRPRHVKFRIGQVVRHKRMGYRGVIVGWDLTAKAPAQWLKDNIPPEQQHTLKNPYYSLLLDVRDIHVPVPFIVYNSEEELEVMTFQTMHFRHQPNYMLLVHGSDKQSFSTAYITQELLQGVQHIKVQHPQIDEFFEAFDGSRFLARSWLKKIYPHDQ